MTRASGRTLSLAASAVTAAIALAGCGSVSKASTPVTSPLALTGGHATLGRLSITRAYIPVPATPTIGVAYFTVTNSGPADRLVSVTTSDFRTATLHRYKKAPDGAESMVPVVHGGVIPAHGLLMLMPGSYHLMLRKPRHPVRQGDIERLTLHFQHAGIVSMEVPVVAATGLPGTSAGDDMPGMNMSGGKM